VGVQRAVEAEDVYGDDTTDSLSPGTPRYEDCHVQMESSSRSMTDPGRKQKGVVYHFWFEADVDVLETDTLLYNGKTLQIDGEPNHWDALGFRYIELRAYLQRG
jgi:hypothetical protein